MKKSYLFSAFAAGMVMLSACSGDGDLTGGNVGNESNDAVQQIVLQVANTGEGLQTRAGRPLYSSEAKQSIENVKVIICDESNTIVKEKTYTNWNTTDSKPYGENGGAHGREVKLTYTGTQKLDNGKYTVYAFGYSNHSDYANLTDEMNKLKESAPFNPNIILNITSENVKGEEIFAGCSTNTIEIKDGHKGFEETVVLNRQVAGTFGYFENIPYVDGASTLRLVASTSNQSVVLGGFNSFDLVGNGTGNGGHINYVVNGTTAATNNVIYSIDLKKWFKQVIDNNGDGLIDGGDNWENKAIATTNATFKEGSVFGGSFVIPFQKNTNKTFVLQLVTSDNIVKKEWDVKLPSTDGQLSEYNLSYWDTKATKHDFASGKVTDEADKYSVVRNHLYGIGVRSKDKPNPGGGSTDPDQPEPLNKKQELTLRVNDNWEVIHQMELE